MWSSTRHKAKGTDQYSRILNSYINKVNGKIMQHYTEMLTEGEPITAAAIRNRYLCLDEKRYTLMKVFKYHNDEMKVGADKGGLSSGSMKNYYSTYKYLEEFLRKRYGRPDITLAELNYRFISEFDKFCRLEKGTGQNGTMKHIQRIKKVINLAIKHDWLVSDPFKLFKCNFKPSKPVFLSEAELARLEEVELPNDKLSMVRDYFVFSCYTGLAHADVSKLTADHIVEGADGQLWAHKDREKTDTSSRVPLLPKAKEIIHKYALHPKVKHDGKLLPVISNQKTNKYLKEIAQLADIRKNMTYHVARHTFATTVTLNNDVPIETVSKMLGHRSMRTTQIYAKVIDKKVSSDMMALSEKLSKR